MGSDPLNRLIGQEDACALMRSLLRRTPNGILISGPIGSGRRTLALGFAEALMCAGADGTVADGDNAARRVRLGTHPDLALLEREPGKRQLGVDAVRALGASFALKPLEAARRVGVLVDADRLTEEAGNALLKLLEEPPEGTHLVLTAPARGSVMETLLSRCVRVHLRPVERPVVLAVLAREGFTGKAAAIAADAAEGSPGRALDLARSDFAALVPQALHLLSSRNAPFEFAFGVQSSWGDKPTLEDSRERVRALLNAALWVVRRQRRALSGMAAEDACTALIPETDSSAEELEARCASLLQCLALIDANVSPPLVLTHAAAMASVSVGAVRTF